MITDLPASRPQGTESTTTAGKGKRPRPPFGVSTVSILAVLIALFSLLPLGYVVYMTVATGWDTAVELIVRPRVGELLLNTILLTVITIPLCLLLGVGGAWLVERTTLRGRRWWAVALAAPLAIPAFVNSYAWVSAVPSLEGLWSGVLIATLSYFPLVYIPAAATLGRLDPAIEQSAASLGLGPWAVFFRVVVPQLRIAMTGGALLVGLHLLAEYGAFAMIRFDTFTTAIMVQFQSTFNGAAGNMLASVLVVLCLFLLLAEVKSRGTARYARIGSGAQGKTTQLPLGGYQLLSPTEPLGAHCAGIRFAALVCPEVGDGRRRRGLGGGGIPSGTSSDPPVRGCWSGCDHCGCLPHGLSGCPAPQLVQQAA